MPTTSEKVVNRALSGTELKAYLRTVFDRLLDNEGMLSEHVAFGRVGGTIRLTLHLDNAYFPKSETTIDLGEGRKLANPSAKVEVAGQTATFKVDNPNAERVRVGLKVPVLTTELDGTRQIQQIQYPPEAAADLPPAEISVIDSTEQAKKDLE